MNKYPFNLIVFICAVISILSFNAYAREQHTFGEAQKNTDDFVINEHRDQEREMMREKSNEDNSWSDELSDRYNRDKLRQEGHNALKEQEEQLRDYSGDAVIRPVEDSFSQRFSEPKVKVESEAMYDLNSDGILQDEEARKMLQDKVVKVNDEGWATVDNDIEEAYDSNKDGIIDQDEVKAIEKDIQK